MRACVLIALLFVSVAFASYSSQWEDFVVAHNKLYASEGEVTRRYEIFKQNLEIVAELNSRQDGALYAIDETADLTYEEYAALKLSNLELNVPAGDYYSADLELTDVPSEVDWREKGVLNPVKNQASCGSCWAFSAVGAIEAAVAIQTGQLPNLSEQQLVDCSSKFGNKGCSGGWMNWAYDYLLVAGGLNSNVTYPYKATQSTCKFDNTSIVTSITNYTKIFPGDEKSLTVAIASTPIAFAMDAGGSQFRFYKSGVYFNSACKTNVPNHAMVLVGYGVENDQEYYLVRNSWGPTWGDNGHIKIARNRNNHCGVSNWAMYPIVKA